MAMLAACGGGSSGSSAGASGGFTPSPTPTPSATTAACSLRARQDWALAQLNEWYLFPTLLNAAANPASYGTVDDYIDALTAPARAQSKDRYFTYLTSIAEENAYYNQGATAGFGIRLSYESNRVFVLEAFEGAPALAGGIDRGTELLQINGQSVGTLMASGGASAVVQALGPDTAGTTRSFVVRDASGVQRTVSLSKAVYDIDPISDRYGAKIIADGTRRVGYVNLRNFITTADPNLRAAFAQFKAQGVTELIVDLRYNGGGLISIAELFGDLMGAGRAGQIFDYITFRDSKASENDSYAFRAQAEAVAPTRVAFIGTGGTASASEMVINGMIPYLGANMALVGSNTYGKPVGQIALDKPECDDRLRAIALKVENASHQGEYFTGLASSVANTCRASDDYTHQLGDPNETMVKVALDFLAGRGCTAIGGVTTQAVAERGLLTRAQPRKTTDLELPGAY
ncbi:MAG TPA: S41 family peptidase [Croceibacterium sp.]|nr:S41 family peptidase [Croceibacterium sp.]